MILMSRYCVKLPTNVPCLLCCSSTRTISHGERSTRTPASRRHFIYAEMSITEQLPEGDGVLGGR